MNRYPDTHVGLTEPKFDPLFYTQDKMLSNVKYYGVCCCYCQYTLPAKGIEVGRVTSCACQICIMLWPMQDLKRLLLASRIPFNVYFN